jgi:regulator of sigma E protease
MNPMQKVLAFLLVIGPLIVFHELGHYWVARLCKVKVLRFSFGFGRVLWSRRFGPDQTEWAISLLPLGGYVKMLDARDPSTAPLDARDEAREFTRQNVWKRMAIIAAGPAANFVLAIAVLAGLYMHGQAEPGTRLRAPVVTSAAYQAGIRGGDQVLAVGGRKVASWDDMRWALVRAAVDKRDVELRLRAAGGASYTALLPAAQLAGRNDDGSRDVLDALGMQPWRPRPSVDQVLPDGAASRAGLLAGDVVTAVDGKPMADALDFIDAVRAAPGRTLAVAVLRAGRPLVLALTPDRDPATGRGVVRAMIAQSLDTVFVRAGPLEALARGAQRTWETSVVTVTMVWKMIAGEASLKNVSGPIAIADVAAQTAQLGLTPFLELAAFISISLGVMNLLPIPVLDGGHLLYYSLEVLTGRPLPARVGEIAQLAGWGLLFMLMALGVFNDLARHV